MTEGLHCVLEQQGLELIHYLDFLVFEHSVAKHVGGPMLPVKTVPLLGIEIDTMIMVMQLPLKKVVQLRTISELAS